MIKFKKEMKDFHNRITKIEEDAKKLSNKLYALSQDLEESMLVVEGSHIRCAKCKNVLDKDLFYRCGRAKNGRRSSCKKCEGEVKKVRRNGRAKTKAKKRKK